MQAAVMIISFFTLVLPLTVSAQVQGDIRLAGPNSNASQGRVEIFYNNQWGTVCDDQFSDSNAIVICRQLGFQPLGAVFTTQPHQFGEGTGPIWIDDLQCGGNENRLENCQFANWGESDCQHDEDVGVICPVSASNPPVVTTTTPAPVVPETGNCSTPDPTIRLYGPANTPGMGVVQLFRNNQWGGVCDNNFDINDAKVICRMLCYDPNVALPGSVNFDMGNITEPMIIQSIDCVGTETSISDCPQTAGSCGRHEMAKVTCVNLDNSASARPSPIVECEDGLITAKFSTIRDPNLEVKHVELAFPVAGDCNINKRLEDIFVVISIPFDECGTNRTANATHITYANTIRYLPTSKTGIVSNANTYMVYVDCILPKGAIANKPIRPITETVTQKAEGQFVVSLNIYRNSSFTTPETDFPLEIPLGSWLNIDLELDNVDQNLRLVVPNCFASPTENREDPVKYPLFTNKCIDDETVGFFPLSDKRFGFRFMTFKFVQYNEVHMHCDAFVCGKDEVDQECDRSCFPPTTAASPGSGRKKRSVHRQMIHVSRGMIVYDPNEPVEIVRPEVPENTSTTRRPDSTKAPSTTRRPDTTKAPSTTIKPETTKTSSTVAPTHSPLITRSTTKSPHNPVSSSHPPGHVTGSGDHVTTRSPSNVVEIPVEDSLMGINGGQSCYVVSLTVWLSSILFYCIFSQL